MNRNASRALVVGFTVVLASLSLPFRVHAEDLFANDFGPGRSVRGTTRVSSRLRAGAIQQGDWNVPSNWRDGWCHRAARTSASIFRYHQ